VGSAFFVQPLKTAPFSSAIIAIRYSFFMCSPFDLSV
jgi:hypothetical protein